MQIAYINGRRLKIALLAGARRLADRAGVLNRINVFPVPDGDTGTNMAGTVQAMAMALSAAPALSLGATARTAADSALMGARGNSGAILAQFFQGLAEELKHKARIAPQAFAQAVEKAVARTYSALSHPREGTILTVLKDWGAALKRVSQRTDDFIVLLKTTIKDARDSLERTKEMLPELKKAGVVDAGALGWVHILEGIVHQISHGNPRDLKTTEDREGIWDDPEGSGEALPESGEPSAFRYCTECMLEGESLNLTAVRETLEPMGDSIVVAGSSRRARVHVHTDVPSRVFRALEDFARVSLQKADDMELQRALTVAPPRCALMVDSTCDMPEAERLRLRVERVPLTVTMDGVPYLDRDGLSSEDFYARMRTPGIELATSQPSDAAFRRKMDILLGASPQAVYLGISDTLSGTLEAGRRAAVARKDPERVHIIDSKTISVAYALLARKAGEAAADGATADEVARLVEELRSRVRLFVAVPDLSGLIKSGRLSGMKGLAARTFGLRPIITTDSDGQAASAGLYVGSGNERSALLKILRRAVRKNAALRGKSKKAESLEIIVGHSGSTEEAHALAEEVRREFPLSREPDVVEISPALALHAGVGALALAVLLPEGKA